MRVLLGTSAGLLLSTPLFFLNAASGGSSVDFGTGPPGLHPHDPQDPDVEVCSTGCSAVPALDKDLSTAEFERLIAAFANQPMSGESEALEALLFHGEATRTLLDSAELDDEREAFLRQELAHTHARLDVRVIDEHGVERLRLGETLVPFGEKQHLHPHETNSLQPPEVSGTVHRVGLKHLWARL